MKIILDTNVFSEFIHPQGSPIVAAWLMRQEDASICTTSVTQAEILFGIRRLPEGRRRSVLLANALKSLDLFHNRSIRYPYQLSRANQKTISGTGNRASLKPESETNPSSAAKN